LRGAGQLPAFSFNLNPATFEYFIGDTIRSFQINVSEEYLTGGTGIYNWHSLDMPDGTDLRIKPTEHEMKNMYDQIIKNSVMPAADNQLALAA
jgi:hypothetical protein